jgi:hypothetical protein
MAWVYLFLTIERSADWKYSSPHSSIVISPSAMTSKNGADMIVTQVFRWVDILKGSQSGASAIGTFRDFPDVVFKTIDISKTPGGL